MVTEGRRMENIVLCWQLVDIHEVKARQPVISHSIRRSIFITLSAWATIVQQPAKAALLFTMATPSTDLQMESQEQTVSEMIASLSAFNISPRTSKKQGDKILRALQMQTEAFERHQQRKEQKRRTLQRRRAQKAETLQQEGFFTATYELPSAMLELIKSLTSGYARTSTYTQGCASSLLETIKSKEFRGTALLSGSIIALKWFTDPPRMLTLLLDVVQFLITTLGAFFRISADAILAQLQTITTAHMEAVSPAQLPEGGDVLHPEAFDVTSYIPLAAAMVSVIASALVGHQLLATPDMMKKVKSFGDLGRSVTGCRQLVENTTTVATWVFETLQNLILGFRSRSMVDTDPICKELGINTPFMEAVEDLIDPNKITDHMMSYEYRPKLVTARTKLIQFSGLRGRRADPQLRAYLDVRVKALTKILFENINHFKKDSNAARNVPFCIQLTGEPGCGKSTVMTKIASNIVKEEACGRVLPNLASCSLTGANKHWDNYGCECTLLIDDAFMTRGSTPGESEYTRFISLISNVSYTVPKADLQSKGMTADQVALVILSSNTFRPEATEINNSKALLRRRHLLWDVRLKTDKDRKTFPTDPFNDFSLYQRLDPLEPSQTRSKLMGFSEMLKVCAKFFKEHMDEQDKIQTPLIIPNGFFDPNAKDVDLPPVPEARSAFSAGLNRLSNSLLSPLTGRKLVGNGPVPEPVVEEEEAPEPERVPGSSLRWEAPVYSPANAARIDRAFGEGAHTHGFKPQSPGFTPPDTLSPESLDDYDYHVEIPCVNWHDDESSPFVKKFNVDVPLYSLSQVPQSVWHKNEIVCCSPFRIEPNFDSWYTYCNATRIFEPKYCDVEVQPLYLMQADLDFDDLMSDHRYMFVEALQNGLCLPPRSFVERLTLGDLSDDEMAWEAMRLTSRAFRETETNQELPCYWNDQDNAVLPYPEHDYGYAASYWGPCNPIVLEMESIASASLLSVATGQAIVSELQTIARIEFVLKALASVAAIFGAVMLFKKVKNMLKKEQVLVPNVDYSSEDLDKFIGSVDPLYQQALLDAVIAKTSEITAHRQVMVDVLLRDDEVRAARAHMTGEGLVYDGTALNTRRAALLAQAEFVKREIDSPVSKKLLKHIHPQSLGENIYNKQRLIRGNIVEFMHSTELKKAAIHGVGIQGHLVLVPRHFREVYEDDTMVTIRIRGVAHNIRFFHKDVHVQGDIYDSDWAIYEMPPQVNSFRNISTFILKDKDLQLLEWNCPIIFQRTDSSTSTRATLDVQEKAIAMPGYTQYKKIAKGLSYERLTVKGDCGLPILLDDNTVQGVLTGIHVAGGGSVSVSQLITHDMWETAVAGLGQRTDFETQPLEMMADFIQTHDEEHVELNKRVQNSSQIPALALVHPKYSTVPNSKSALAKSEVTRMHEINGEEFFPTKRATPTFSLLDHRVDEAVREAGIKPMSMGLNKYAVAPKVFSSRSMALAFATIATMLSTIVPKYITKRLLTFDESLNGVKNVIKAIDTHTSMGFPYVKLSGGMKGKSAILTDENDAYRTGLEAHYVLNEQDDAPKYKGKLLSRYMMDEFDQTEKTIRAGVIPTYLAYENMKDELLSEKKIRAGKVRTFECLPLHITLLTRKYFGVFMGAMQQNCVEMPISVGIDPTGHDWTRLYTRMTRFGKKSLIAGDYSNWDGILMPDVMLEGAKLINKWYGDSQENQNARIALVMSFINTYIIVLNTVVQKRSGMPSGVPLTAPLNSLCDWYYLLCAIVEILEKEGFEQKEDRTIDVDLLRDNTELACYGDDHLAALSTLLRKYVTFQKIQSFFLDLGIGYTDSQKRETVTFDFESIHEVTYLKRRFLPDSQRPTLIRAPLAIDSITDMIHWTKHSNATSQNQVFKQRVETFETELARHDKQTYDRYIGVFNAAVTFVQAQTPKVANNFNQIFTPYTTHSNTFYSKMGTSQQPAALSCSAVRED